MTDREYVRSVYKDMLNHYCDNIGKLSKYTKEKITIKMITVLTQRYLELGGKLNLETNDIGEEGLEEL